MICNRKVLCLDDDETTQAVVASCLTDFHVVKSLSVKEAEEQIKHHEFVGLLIDIQLPDGDGLRFLNQFYNEPKNRKVPVLVLSEHFEIANKVMAFTLGAEDFISKPFDPIELNVRLSAKVSRREADQDLLSQRQVGDVLIDFGRQKTYKLTDHHEEELHLTCTEMKIFSVLTRRLEQVFSRGQLMNMVWGETFISDRTVDSHVAHLRQKIEGTQVAIETSKNLGYRALLR